MDKKMKKPIPFQSDVLIMEALLNNDDNITSIDNSFRFRASCNRTIISSINLHIKNILGYKPIEKMKHLSEDNKVFSTYHIIDDYKARLEISKYLSKLKDKQKKVNDEVVKFGDHSTSSSGDK